MKTKDQSLLEEAYNKIVTEALFPPDVEQALRAASHAAKQDEMPSKDIQLKVAEHPRAAAALVKIVVDELRRGLGQIEPAVYDAIKTDKMLAGELNNYLMKRGFSVAVHTGLQ